MHPFITSVQPPLEMVEPAYYFVFAGSHILVIEDEDEMRLPRLASLEANPEIKNASIRQLHLGYIDSAPPIHCFAVEVPKDTAVPEKMSFVNLRQLYKHVTDEEMSLAGTRFTTD